MGVLLLTRFVQFLKLFVLIILFCSVVDIEEKGT